MLTTQIKHLVSNKVKVVVSDKVKVVVSDKVKVAFYGTLNDVITHYNQRQEMDNWRSYEWEMTRISGL